MSARKSYANLIATPVPQSEPHSPEQVQNNAGGFVFALDDWKRLDRFLILGADTNTYYQKAAALTRENAACVQRCLDADHLRAVGRIHGMSNEGRAPKNDAAVFALALASVHPNVKARQAAFAALSGVCRTSTHLFQFLECRKALGGGWGRAGKQAVARWYDGRSVEAVAYQAVKYRSRGEFTHKRVLQTARWRNKDTDERVALYKWMKGEPCVETLLPSVVQGHILAMSHKDNPKAIAELVHTNGLPWEAVPTEVTKDPDVWKAFLPGLGATALIRNLGAMTSYGVLKPLSIEARFVCEQLTNPELLRKGRVHPFNVLLAGAAYRAGQSQFRGRKDGNALSWEPVPQIQAALEKAFYLSFKAIEPSGKRTLIGLDVSGSMSSPLMGSALSVCEGAAAMAMTVMRTEPNWHVYAFDRGLRDLRLTPDMSLADVTAKTRDVTGGGTDCALPMLYAYDKELEVDVFQVFTDNETWAGREHPVAALKRYRKASGINAKLVVVGMTSTGFTIADPADPGMLDVVGFDSAAPAVMAEFARG